MGCQYGDRKVCVCLLSFSGSAEGGQANKKKGLARVWLGFVGHVL